MGPFLLGRCIGRGGTAEVWSGVHVGQGVPVAVKVMTGERSRREAFRAAFRNEVQAVASLDHPGIVLVFDHAEIGPEGEDASGGLLPANSPALALELADRGTLADLLPLGLSWEDIRRILLSLLDALGHAHARGVVHRDLKPSNILAFADGTGPPRLKLADFGLAQAVEREVRSDSTEVVCGTPSYMAPEQLRGQWRDYGPWTDLYALGCLAWSLATGRPPFTSASLFELVQLQMNEPPPRFAPLVPVPKGFQGWLRRLLQKDPGRRFLRAADAAWALLGLGAPEDGGRIGKGVIDPLEATTDVVTFEGLWPSPEPGGSDRPADPAGEEPPSPRRSPPFPSSWERPEKGPLPMRLVGAGLGLYGLRSIPLLGRPEERDALWQALTRVHAERKARLVLLHGMAGAGKTHLAEWMAERAHEVGGATVLRATHGPSPGGGDGLPRMMARHFRCAGLSPEEILERMEKLLRGRKVTDEAEWQGLTELMAPGASHPRTARERFGLIERHVERLTHQRPVLLLLDDVQWSAESIAFAHHLLERREAEPMPVLLLLTVRDEALAERLLEAAALDDLLTLPGAARLEVPPLPAEERAVLTRDVLGLDGGLAAEVDARTGGNPLFAIQLVGDWVQRGLIEVGETGFVRRPGAEVWLPDDLHQVWADRVDRLLEGHPPGCREALEIAAVLSPSVDRREWEAACRAGSAPCPPSLPESLVASRLAVRTEEGWSFVHAMLRESLERMARESGRLPAHHRACAAMLARRAEAGERGAAERWARHLLAAGSPAAAVAPLLAAARERRETSDYPTAMDLLARRDRILQELGAALRDPRWGEGWVLRARIHLHQGELREVFRWAGRAVSGGLEGDWTAIRSESLRLLGDAARRRGDLPEAARLYERCIALPDNPHGAAASLWGLGDVARQKGDLRQARGLFDRSLRLYEEIGDAHGLADHRIGLADLARQRRDVAAAEGFYVEAAARFEELGNRYGLARGLNGLGEVARLRGNMEEAGRLYERSRSILAELSSADEIFPRVNLAFLSLAAGQFGRARRELEESRSLLGGMGWGSLLTSVHAALLSCAAQARNWNLWDDGFAIVSPAVSESGIVEPDLAWAAELAGRLTEWAGEKARAKAVYELALAQWRALEDADGCARMERALAVL